MDTGSMLTPEEYAALAGLTCSVDHVRVTCDWTVSGSLVRISVECPPEMEERARRWLERQSRANRMRCDVWSEDVLTCDPSGRSWDERARGGGARHGGRG